MIQDPNALPVPAKPKAPQPQPATPTPLPVAQPAVQPAAPATPATPPAAPATPPQAAGSIPLASQQPAVTAAPLPVAQPYTGAVTPSTGQPVAAGANPWTGPDGAPWTGSLAQSPSDIMAQYRQDHISDPEAIARNATYGLDAYGNPTGGGAPQNAGLPPVSGDVPGGGSQGTPFPMELPVASSTSANNGQATGSPMPTAPTSSLAMAGPTFTPTASDQGNYLDKTISPGPTADRFGIAKSRLDEFAKSSDPYYQKSLRDATSQAAGSGGLGSGMLRTSLGDLAYNRDLQLDSAGKGFLNNALEGSIGDKYKDVGIAQQQQGFQAGQSNTDRAFNNQEQGQAFDQQAREIALEEALTQGDFGRYQAILAAGEAGNPSGTALTLAGNYGDQAGQAGQAAGNLISGSVANQNSQLPPWLIEMLMKNGGNGTGAQPAYDPVYGDG